MDGLMFDSERVCFQGYVQEMGKLGFTFTEDFYRTLLGKTIPAIHELNYREFGHDFDLDAVIERVYQYVAHYFATQGVPIKKGLLELLEYLKKIGVRTAVATSSSRDRVDTMLAQAGLQSTFDASVCGDEVTHSKPHPEIFLRACEKLDVAPSEALVLEDSEAGIQAAYAGHIPVICVPDMKIPDPEYAAMAWQVLDSLTEVKEFLEKNE